MYLGYCPFIYINVILYFILNVYKCYFVYMYPHLDLNSITDEDASRNVLQVVFF